MKNIPIIIGTALVTLLLGCSTTRVALAPVGPNPAGLDNQAPNGQLEVFSALLGRTEGDNPTWFQHSDYTVLTRQGQSLKHVANRAGYYSPNPRLINLPPGQYVVKARAKDYLSVTVPVVIAPGRITRVHLDDVWQPATKNHKTELVSLPTGFPVGWSLNAK